MNVIEPGHVYEVSSLDGGTPQVLTFVKREGELHPGNVGHHPGTNMQEVVRCLIDRCDYVNRQLPCQETQEALDHLTLAIWLLEIRAAKRHGRPIPGRHDVVSGATACKTCGHAGCPGCRRHT